MINLTECEKFKATFNHVAFTKDQVPKIYGTIAFFSYCGTLYSVQYLHDKNGKAEKDIQAQLMKQIAKEKIALYRTESHYGGYNMGMSDLMGVWLGCAIGVEVKKGKSPLMIDRNKIKFFKRWLTEGGIYILTNVEINLNQLLDAVHLEREMVA